MDLSMFNTNWIWLTDWTPQDNDDVRIVYFRKEFSIGAGELPESCVIRITADSRYKLYINGTFVQKGPQKALNLKEWYVDTADIAPFLKEGVNTAAVEVIRFPASINSRLNPKNNDSLYRTEMPHLYIEDTNGSPDPRVPRDPSLVTLAGKSGWKCTINREIRVFGEDAHPAPIHAQEDVTATAAFSGWKTSGYDDSSWQDSAPYLYFDVSAGDAPGNLVPRTIPAQRHEDRCFDGVSWIRSAEQVEPAALESDFNAMLQGSGCVVIPAGTTQVVEISAGAEECGYLLYSLAGGKGAKISTLCSECYAYPQPDKPSPFGGVMMPSNPLKGDRTDAENGKLFGHTSYYTAAGYGTEQAPELYEPYWFRTFRYIQLKIETADEPLTILGFSYRSTGYPLDVKTTFAVSDPTFAPIWDISVRTLERCMHETYFDCPFYEQLQYAMDSRNEILYTYGTSADDRLARQAMDAFRCSQRPDGMTNSDAPTLKSNVIPGFSIYYSLMVHDHMMYYGDKDLVRLHMPAIDQILAFFDRNLNDLGLVGHVGGPIMREKYWSFIDWSNKWNANAGVPTATTQGTGSITMESLLYLYGLQNAADIARFVGRNGLAEEYLERAGRIAQAIQKNCFGTWTAPDGTAHTLVQDGPGIDEYSVHCQVFAVLTGVVTPEDGRKMLEATVGCDELAQSSVSFMFYLFRALEMTGWYEKTDDLWNLWRKMVDNHLTTCIENDTDERSDCHAWASLMCYELPSVILGVRPAAPGFTKVSICPQMGKLSYASGDVITPRGSVHVEWKKLPDGSCDLHYTLPEGMEAV